MTSNPVGIQPKRSNEMKKLIIVVAMLFPFSGHAEQILFHCNFDRYADANEQRFQEQDFSFKVLLEIDGSSVKASIIGDIASPLVIRFGELGHFNFVEVTGVGNLNITTIMANGKAVHSRHIVMSESKSMFSQYYGTCLPK